MGQFAAKVILAKTPKPKWDDMGDLFKTIHQAKKQCLLNDKSLLQRHTRMSYSLEPRPLNEWERICNDIIHYNGKYSEYLTEKTLVVLLREAYLSLIRPCGKETWRVSSEMLYRHHYDNYDKFDYNIIAAGLPMQQGLHHDLLFDGRPRRGIVVNKGRKDLPKLLGAKLNRGAKGDLSKFVMTKEQRSA